VESENLKRQAAEQAVEYIQSGMVVGLGHGSTAIYAVRRLARLLETGALQDIVGVPCSRFIEAEAARLGIPLTTLETHPQIDLTIDGADEVDPHLELIKGGGGALLREKIVAQATVREIIVVDESKLSPALCTHWPVPVEVIPFGWSAQAAFLEKLGGRPQMRHNPDGVPFKTDHGNLILDCRFDPIPAPAELAAKIKARAGIVEHGFFLGVASEVIVAGQNGIRRLKRPS
jgi:ribose 5-phosphate isomerase A